MCLLPLIITLYVKFRISCRLCNNFFNIFLIFIKKLLTKFSSHSIISNVSGTRQNTKDMREWLSWWSTTLPRSGPRVRVPSRALFYQKKDIIQMSFFLINRVLPDSNFRVSSLPLRSAHSGHPPDVLRRVALATLFHSAAVRSCPEGFLIHRT